MTTHSTIAEERLAELGIHLPDPPTFFGAYVPTVQTGNLLFPSGMLATSGHTATVVGVVGKDLDVKAGREAACTAALNVLALTKKQLGSLNRVSHVVRLGVYVAATPEFTEHLPVRPANRVEGSRHQRPGAKRWSLRRRHLEATPTPHRDLRARRQPARLKPARKPR